MPTLCMLAGGGHTGRDQPDGAEKQSTELHDLVQRFPTEATRLHGHMGYADLVTVVMHFV